MWRLGWELCLRGLAPLFCVWRLWGSAVVDVGFGGRFVNGLPFALFVNAFAVLFEDQGASIVGRQLETPVITVEFGKSVAFG